MNDIMDNALNQIKNWKNFSDIQKKVRRHFKYLFQHGFIVVHKKYQPEHMGYWEITLLSDDCAIQIYDDRGTILISIGTVKLENWVGISTVIFYITDEKELIEDFEGESREQDKQLIRLAKILKNHVEEISKVFQNFKQHENGLSMANRKVLDLSMERYSKRYDLQKYIPKRVK